ncbi:MAG: hypothetical protein ACI9EF_003864 [Pseudohongiellaceae bacterium]|jgi:hypothetical protein
MTVTDLAKRRPGPDEYPDFFAGYMALVPDGDIISILREQLSETLALLRDIPQSQHDFSYASGKWTLKQVLGHVMDGEWVFSYRALRFARGDQTPLPGMDQDVFADGANHAQRPLKDLLLEFEHLRRANITLFAGFTPDILDRRGTASESSFTVRALVYFHAGHLAHHINVLKDRYLAGSEDGGELS